MDNYPLRLYGEDLKEYYFTDFDTFKGYGNQKTLILQKIMRLFMIISGIVLLKLL